MKPLHLSKQLVSQIQREGEKAFPNECCGIMFGRDEADGRFVESLQAVDNSFDAGEQYHRFSISPKQLMEAEDQAGKTGKLVLGFYHSHPNHPARPSEYDRQHAWPFYSYVIVSIMNGKADVMTSWMLNDTTEQFEQQEIKEI